MHGEGGVTMYYAWLFYAWFYYNLVRKFKNGIICRRITGLEG